MAQTTPAKPTRPLTTTEGFVAGGIAACIAVFNLWQSDLDELLKLLQVTFSNPAEVAKTRMQLQGELAKSGAERIYKSAPDAIVKTFRNEGIRGLQRGLGPAVRPHIFFLVIL
jgi:solute carrier family 25, member 34/35